VKVSHLRLATHLMVALVTFGALVWTALDMRALAKGMPAARLTRFSAGVLAILAVQLAYGALVAGLRAGQVAPDWPLMQGKLFPAGIDWSQGLVDAMTGDPFLVHFIHRWWAWVVVAVLIVMGRKLRRADARPASVAIHSAFGLQILLGIATVMTGVELWLAVMHQLTGALLVAATVWGAHGLGRRG
jgi:cytochrome c oxidase assembly protein subunit 15